MATTRLSQRVPPVSVSRRTHSCSPGLAARCGLSLTIQEEAEHGATAALPRPKHAESCAAQPGPGGSPRRGAARPAEGRGELYPVSFELRTPKGAQIPAFGSTGGRGAPPPPGQSRNGRGPAPARRARPLPPPAHADTARGGPRGGGGGKRRGCGRGGSEAPLARAGREEAREAALP